MQIGFVLPTAEEAQTIDKLQARVSALREDQYAYFEHLLWSWRLFQYRAPLALAIIARAIRRTENDRP